MLILFLHGWQSTPGGLKPTYLKDHGHEIWNLLAYDLARQYSERYNARYGTGLLPESAPMVEDITEFWGRHFVGRGWRRRLTK